MKLYLKLLLMLNFISPIAAMDGEKGTEVVVGADDAAGEDAEVAEKGGAYEAPAKIDFHFSSQGSDLGAISLDMDDINQFGLLKLYWDSGVDAVNLDDFKVTQSDFNYYLLQLVVLVSADDESVSSDSESSDGECALNTLIREISETNSWFNVAYLAGFLQLNNKAVLSIIKENFLDSLFFSLGTRQFAKVLENVTSDACDFAYLQDALQEEIKNNISHSVNTSGAACDQVFSACGKFLFTSSDDCSSKIYMWDAATFEYVNEFSLDDDVAISLDVSSDGTRLVCGTYNNYVVVFDLGVGADILTLDGHSASVSKVKFSDDCTKIISGCENGVICIWNAETGELLNVFDSAAEEFVIEKGEGSVASEGGAGGDSDGDVVMDVVGSGDSGGEDESASEGGSVDDLKDIVSVHLTADGSRAVFIYTCSLFEPNKIFVLNLADNTIIKKFEYNPDEFKVIDVCFEYGRDDMVILRYFQDHICYESIWDVDMPDSVPGDGEAIEENPFMACSPGGKLLAISNGVGEFTIKNIALSKAVKAIGGLSILNLQELFVLSYFANKASDNYGLTLNLDEDEIGLFCELNPVLQRALQEIGVVNIEGGEAVEEVGGAAARAGTGE